ncbi:2-amino-4-hydroxy-6-hydroxymethyldihydropteridine diphosphokinase [uncultured Proteiniphilum sp.]|uniref:2-amino-4-hydroxy-6- hydroxymethyldihydropteridine diphosphokinase n=1 Tax=uncultured Proteiniphilum sp. TaxID=497637 RepID=UPI002625AE90|nr:2-amino-4-hydroxy-6-hydroxymethyldihydropteridine diphosphokinase [uncultured Proteiniphilum sp.]
MNHVYLALGSNLGDKQKNIEEALDKIEERIGSIISLSAFHLTIPLGFQSENLFVNCVCEVVTDMNIYRLFAITQQIEKETGRADKSKNGRYADRTIDIDLILAGNLVIDTPELTVPHPRFHTRSFVLDPLFEIAPDLVHPLSGKTIRELREELDRNGPPALKDDHAV